MRSYLGRRRFLAVSGAAAGFALAVPGARAADSHVTHQWRGTALGAQARITLFHPDAAVAQNLIALCVDEVARLEKIFSLYRADSALSILNRDGVLPNPPLDLVQLLGDSRRFGMLTEGAFDVTVQPLWQLYAAHFARANADPAGPAAEDVEQARAFVDYRRVDIGLGQISLLKPGMAVTLNGIAQGYITDRVADLLRDNGVDRVMVDLGEIRALGRHPDGRPWQVGLAEPETPDRVERSIEIVDRAVATSSSFGTRFDSDGRFHHLFDPTSGRPHSGYRGVTVVAPRATAADALSTGFAVAGPDLVDRVLEKLQGVAVYLTLARGKRIKKGTA